MKKNLRLVSVAAAALLAVAPVATSVVPTVGANAVQAANNPKESTATNPWNLNGSTQNSTNNTTSTAPSNAPSDNPYFTYGSDVLYQAGNSGTDNVVRNGITIKMGEDAATITKDLNDLKLVYYASTGNQAGKPVTFTEKDVISALEKQNVEFKGKNGTHISKLPSSSFNMTISQTEGTKTATAQIPFIVAGSNTGSSVDTDAPVFLVNGTKAGSNPLVYQVAVNSQFNPLNFTTADGSTVAFSAQQTENNGTAVSVTATSNPVNTSEAGRFYNVTLTATGLTGKKSTLTYTVLVTPSTKQTLHAAAGQTTIPTYSFYGINRMSNSTTFKDGDQVYVGNTPRTYNNVSYSQVSTKSKSDANSSNVWVETSALVTPTTPTTPSDSNTQTETVMVDSRAYDKSGNYLGHMYYAYDSIEIVPTVVTINGKTYYKVANKDEYVRVTNITGNQRTLRHNAYIYWSSYRRTPGTGKMYRGQTVTTYGPAMRFKNGKKYYRIQGCRNNNKRYIKAANFY